MRIPLFVLAFIVGPVRTEIDPVEQKEVVTHLQKYSRCGCLLTWPFGFHVWFLWKRQDSYVVNGEEHWFPGTEQGIYMRTPGYRYDKDLGMKWTWGYVGTHWD